MLLGLIRNIYLFGYENRCWYTDCAPTNGPTKELSDNLFKNGKTQGMKLLPRDRAQCQLKKQGSGDSL